MNRLTSAFLSLYLLTLPIVAYLDFTDEQAPALAAVSLYASLVPVAALPKLLEADTLEPFVGAACMAAASKALVPAVDEGAHALFDLAFFAAVAWFGSKRRDKCGVGPLARARASG